MIEPTDETLRRWLLHKVPAAQAEDLEHRLLVDGDFGERLRAAETDLLDEFARGELDEGDRAITAERFAATARDRMRVRIAVALARIARRAPAPLRGAHARRHGASDAPARSPRRIGMRRVAAAGLLASACALVIAVIGLNQRFTASFPEPRAGSETTITLLADHERGANAERVALAPGASKVRLQAEVDAADPRARYALSVEDAGGRTVFTASGIAAREAGPYHFVEVVFDAGKLGPGSHQVRVAAEGSAQPASLWTLETRNE